MKKGLDYFVPIVKRDKHFILPGFIEGDFAEAYMGAREGILKRKEMNNLEIFSYAKIRNNNLTDLNIFEHILAQAILSNFGYRVANLGDFNEISKSSIMNNRFLDEEGGEDSTGLMLGTSLHGTKNGEFYHDGNLWSQLDSSKYNVGKVPINFNFSDFEMILDEEFEDGINLKIKKDAIPKYFPAFHWRNGNKGFDKIENDKIEFKKATKSKYTLITNKFEGLMNYSMSPHLLMHTPNFQYPDANKLLIF